MNRFGGITAAVVSGLVVALLSTPASATVPVPPERDPFYAAPADLADLPPGALIRQRTVSTVVGSLGLVESASKQVLYRTTDAHGGPVATVATLLVPRVRAPGPAKLVVYNPPYDSLTHACAPSVTLRSLSAPTQSADPQLLLLLTQGWHVLVADYEGPDSQFAVGRMAGHAVLDAARAFTENSVGRLRPDTPVTMFGLSGGAIATMWGNSLWSSYAPDVNLVGVAAGALPARISEAIAPLDGQLGFGAAIAVLVGTDRAYPDMDLDSLLTEQGRRLAAQVADDHLGCGQAPQSVPFGTVRGNFVVDTGAELADLPQIREVLDRSDIGEAPAFGAPSYFWHNGMDDVAPVGQADAAVAEQCAKGSTIEYVRFPIGNHVLTAVALPSMIASLHARFRGVPPKQTC